MSERMIKGIDRFMDAVEFAIRLPTYTFARVAFFESHKEAWRAPDSHRYWLEGTASCLAWFYLIIQVAVHVHSAGGVQ